MDDARALALICAALRGERTPWPAEFGEAEVAAILRQASFHGVGPLLHARADAVRDWPDRLRAGLRERAVAAKFWEEQHLAVLRRVVSGMSARGVAPVFLKGTALAYSLFASPHLRERSDSDIIVPRHSREAARAALLEAGFEELPPIRTEGTYQRSYLLAGEQGFGHKIDLHWEIGSSPFLSRLFELGEVASAAVDLPALGAGARALAPVDAVLFACVHRELHQVSPMFFEGERHRVAERLIWLYDLRLLAGVLTGPDWAELVARAFRKGLAAVCCTTLMRARAIFAAPCPDEVLFALLAAPRHERAAVYLRADEVGRRWIDMRTLSGVGRKVRYVRDTLVPPPAYMRAMHPAEPPLRLPWLYLKRAATRIYSALRQR